MSNCYGPQEPLNPSKKPKDGPYQPGCYYLEDNRWVEYVAHLEREIESLRATVTVLESFRPLWAEGWTTDGIAAQASCGALTQLWELLDVKHQTDAVTTLRRLLAETEGLRSFKRSVDEALNSGDGSYHL